MKEDRGPLKWGWILCTKEARAKMEKEEQEEECIIIEEGRSFSRAIGREIAGGDRATLSVSIERPRASWTYKRNSCTRPRDLCTRGGGSRVLQPRGKHGGRSFI